MTYIEKSILITVTGKAHRCNRHVGDAKLDFCLWVLQLLVINKPMGSYR